MTPPTQAQVEELRRLLEAATQGEWKVCGGYTPAYSAINSPSGYVVYRMADKAVDTEAGHPIDAPDYDEQRANIQLIAAMKNALPGLLDALGLERGEPVGIVRMCGSAGQEPIIEWQGIDSVPSGTSLYTRSGVKAMLLASKDGHPVRCPHCPDQGWYEVQRMGKPPEQEQCEFCHTTPNSVFNLASKDGQQGEKA